MHKRHIIDPSFTREELLARHELELAWFEASHKKNTRKAPAKKTPAATKVTKATTPTQVKTTRKARTSSSVNARVQERMAESRARVASGEALAEEFDYGWDENDMMVMQ